MTVPNEKLIYAYVGSWDITKHRADIGLRVYRYDPASAEMEFIKSVAPEISVGATCFNRDLSILYCTNEFSTLPGFSSGGGGQVYAFRVDPVQGDLIEINRQPSFGSLPSYVAVDRQGTYLLATNHTGKDPITKTARDSSGKYVITLEYDDATTVLFPLNEDGSIADPCDIHRHPGTGGPLTHQTHAQLHSIMMSPSGNLFAVCDKGNDRIALIRIDREERKLLLCNGEGFEALPGSLPRYSVFHPQQPYLFVNHEGKAVVSALRYDECGNLSLICIESALPDDIQDRPGMKQSDLRIHPSGKYLYSLVRGIHAITVFEINRDTGSITRKQTVHLEGRNPRGCAISPDGNFIHVAMLDSDKVVALAIGEDGSLAPTEQSVTCPSPANITFWPSQAARAADGGAL